MSHKNLKNILHVELFRKSKNFVINKKYLKKWCFALVSVYTLSTFFMFLKFYAT